MSEALKSSSLSEALGSTDRIAREPTTFEVVFNRAVTAATISFAALSVLLVFYILGQVGWNALPAIKADGISPLTNTTWNPLKDEYGMLPAIVGTLISSILALMLGTLFGVAIAIFLTQDFLHKKAALILKNIVDLLAAIPSVVYGLWGLAVIMPMMRPASEWFYNNFGEWVPFVGTPLGIGGLAPASLVLAIMVLPTICAISRDAIAAVHPRIKEAAYGLGATRWEVIFGVMLPTASGGIFGGMILGFGRALGETMALAMLMGNRNELSWSLFAPGNTLAALIANNYKEAGEDMTPRLIYAALVLLIITMIVNVFGTFMLQRAAARFKGAR